MKVIDEAKTPSGVKLELVDWSDELPAMHKKSDTIYARPSIDGLQSRLLAFQLEEPCRYKSDPSKSDEENRRIFEAGLAAKLDEIEQKEMNRGGQKC